MAIGYQLPADRQLPAEWKGKKPVHVEPRPYIDEAHDEPRYQVLMSDATKELVPLSAFPKKEA